MTNRDLVVRVPTSLGAVGTAVTLVQWLVAPGEGVAGEEPLVELLSDGVLLVLETPCSGSLTAMTIVARGQTQVGAQIGVWTPSSLPQHGGVPHP